MSLATVGDIRQAISPATMWPRMHLVPRRSLTYQRPIIPSLVLALIGACAAPRGGGDAGPWPDRGAALAAFARPPDAPVADAARTRAAQEAAAWFRLGVRAQQEGALERAAAAYRRAVAANPYEVEMHAHRAYQDAMRALGHGPALADWYADFARAAAGTPRAALAVYLHSRARDDPDEALRLLRAAPAVAGVEALRWIAYGMAVREEELGRADDALAHYRQAARQAPFWPEPRLGAARLLAARGEAAAAAAEYRAAVQAGARTAEVYRGWAAACYEVVRGLDPAGDEFPTAGAALRAVYEEADAAFPDELEFALARGFALGAFGDPADGAAAWEALLSERLTEAAHARRAYRWFAEHEQPAWAARVLQAAVQAWPDEPFFARELGAHYVAGGRYAEARRWYERCRARFPDQPHFAFALGLVLEEGLAPDAPAEERRTLRAEARALYGVVVAAGGEDADLARARLAALGAED